MTVETYSEEDTLALGRWLGETAAEGTVYALEGDLGAGKTVLAKGVAEGLGITEPVNSPTFTILQIYPGGRLPLYHFDVYRIMDIGEMDEIGYEEYFYGQGVCLIEWANLITELLPPDTIRIQMEQDAVYGFCYRRITITQ